MCRALTILVSVLLVLLMLVACAAPQAPTPMPKPGPPTPTPEPSPAPETGEEPRPLVIEEPEDLLHIQFVSDGYHVQQVLPSAFGLCAQLALLPNGDITMSSYSQSIHLLSDGIVRTLVADWGVKAAVAALPDGRICYSKYDQLLAINPDTGATELLCSIPTGDIVSALAADKTGKIYAATCRKNLYCFTADGNRTTIATNLPFEGNITDMDIADDGNIYIAGCKLLIAVRPDGNVTMIADDLHDEPTWCEIDPDGHLYVKDIFSGVRRFNPETGTLTPLKINCFTGVSDFLALSSDKFLFFKDSDLILNYDLKTNTSAPIFVNAVNSGAFATSRDDAVYFTTPSLPPVLKSHIIHLQVDGTREEPTGLTFTYISAADVDKENRLCLYADGNFHRVEPDGSITSFAPKFSPRQDADGKTNIAVGPDGLWYCITTNFADSIRVWRVDDTGEVNFLPIIFDRASFGNVYRVSDARIDVGDNGRLALIVTAEGSKGHGPYYQRVYRADADGTNLTQIATLDSNRIAGMVDIAVGPNNDVFVLTCQKNQRFSEVFYRINSENEVTKFLEMGAGRDPKSMDIDPAGNVWFCTTVGIFRVTH